MSGAEGSGGREGGLDLPVVDGHELDEERRDALRPGGTLTGRDGRPRRLPRHFYEVESWEVARATPLADHFTLHELMAVDVREAPAVRRWPRYVPLAVGLLGAHLELLRKAVGTRVWIAANGGYRSPSHALTDHASLHCWATAANVYMVGEELLDGRERIERAAAVVGEVSPAAWVRPWGHEKGLADDHLHLDLGYVLVTPRQGGPDDG